MRALGTVCGGMVAAALAILAIPAIAQPVQGTPQGRDANGRDAASRERRGSRGTPPAAAGVEAAQPESGPFNNQLRKFSDPLGANGR